MPTGPGSPAARRRRSPAVGRGSPRRPRPRAPSTAWPARTKPVRAGTTRRIVDLVIVGLPGSGKSVVGKRLAHRHGATFIDLDERIEREDGRPIPTIFEEDGEQAFRTLERRAVVDLGPADPERGLRRIVATGGGAVVDPRNRWALYRGR